jgi:hypothetical protein
VRRGDALRLLFIPNFVTIGLIKYIGGEGELTRGIELKSYFPLTLLDEVKLIEGGDIFRSILLLQRLHCALLSDFLFPSLRSV